MPISSPNREDSNKWSNIGFGEEIMQAVMIEVYFMHLFWSSDKGNVTERKADSIDTNVIRQLPEALRCVHRLGKYLTQTTGKGNFDANIDQP